MTRDEIITVLKRNGFKLGFNDRVVFGAFKDTITIVVSMLGSNTTLSVKFNGKENKQKSIRLMSKLFPTALYKEIDVPVPESIKASYFSLERTH